MRKITFIAGNSPVRQGTKKKLVVSMDSGFNNNKAFYGQARENLQRNLEIVSSIMVLRVVVILISHLKCCLGMIRRLILI